MARFYLPGSQIQNNRGTVSGGELDHLRKVLRLRPGDPVTFFDDKGWEHEGVVRSFTANQGEIDILKSSQTDRESALEVTLALGLTKGEKVDFVVEKATELGVGTVVPFFSAYTVPRLDARKIVTRSERWKKVALSAAKQCGRTRIPVISPPCDFQELLQKPWSCELKLFFWEKESRQGLNRMRETKLEPRSLLVVIGPEGGFSPGEARQAIDHGFQPVRLGRRILRAETAAVTALSLVQFLWGDLS